MAQDLEDEMFLDAQGLQPEEFHWVKRPVIVFADSTSDPAFKRQLELLRANPDALLERDVVVITDTDPQPPSAFRKRFRPRGFSLVLMDKDGKTTLRKPLPWDIREITRAIDKFPIARQEMLERYPGRN
ncbi:MAG: DUF4174 domain-containing protein [Pseudorhodobacter sp.]